MAENLPTRVTERKTGSPSLLLTTRDLTVDPPLALGETPQHDGSAIRIGNGPKRRIFRWSQEAVRLVMEYRERLNGAPPHDAERRRLVAKLTKVSKNPPDACLRFLRRYGVAKMRSYRAWTIREQQRLVELLDEVPVEEAARILDRPSASVRAMLHRLGLGVRQRREWFTVSLLAQALHIGRDVVRRWVDRGWLQCRVVQTQSVKLQIIDADQFCSFIKSYGHKVVGNRLSSEGLAFVRDYVFPRPHADLLSVRGPNINKPQGGLGKGTSQSCLAG
jgi:hypothetical protein